MDLSVETIETLPMILMSGPDTGSREKLGVRIKSLKPNCNTLASDDQMKTLTQMMLKMNPN